MATVGGVAGLGTGLLGGLSGGLGASYCGSSTTPRLYAKQIEGDFSRPSDALLAKDIGLLMDTVREDVTALMLEGVQKTASFCASLCAERVVAARRELQRRWKEERYELEKYGRGGTGVPNAGGANAGTTPRSTPRATPRATPRDIAAEGELKFRIGNPVVSKAAVPPNFEINPRPAYSPIIRSASCIGGSLANPMDFNYCGMDGTRTPQGATPRTTPRIVSRDLLSAPQHLPVSSARGEASPDRIATAEYDAAYIDAHDAVQTLEERTHAASHAMKLIEETLQGFSSTPTTTPLATPAATPAHPPSGYNVGSYSSGSYGFQSTGPAAFDGAALAGGFAGGSYVGHASSDITRALVPHTMPPRSWDPPQRESDNLGAGSGSGAPPRVWEAIGNGVVKTGYISAPTIDQEGSVSLASPIPRAATIQPPAVPVETVTRDPSPPPRPCSPSNCCNEVVTNSLQKPQRYGGSCASSMMDGTSAFDGSESGVCNRASDFHGS